MVQWLGLHAFAAKGEGSIPGLETKILQARWSSQKKKKEKEKEICTNSSKYKKYLPPHFHPCPPAFQYPSHCCYQFSFSTEMVVLHCLLLAFFHVKYTLESFFFLPAAQIFYYY